MKKLVVGIIAVMALVVAGMPFINGLIIQKGVTRSVSEFNSMYGEAGPDVNIELVRYDRGFSSSEIEYRLNLGEVSAVSGVDAIVFVERAKHTYTGAVSETSLEKNEWYKKFIDTHLGGKDPFSLVTEYSLTGDFRSVFGMEPFSVEIEGEQLQARAAEIIVESDFDFSQVKTSGSWEGLLVDGKMEISSIDFASDIEMISTYIYDGDMSFSLGNMMVREQGLDSSLSNLRGEYDVVYNEQNNTLDVDAVYGIESMVSNSEYIDNASARFGVKGLDAEAYEEAMDLYMQMVSAMLTEIAALEQNPEQIPDAIEAKMMEIGMQMMGVYEKFLKSGLEFYIKDLQASLPQGEIKGNFQMKLEQDITMAQMFPMMNQPQLLFDYLSYKADFSMPAVLGGGNPQLVQPVYPGMKTGIFIEEGENLIHSSETKNKQLYINGELLNLN